MWYTLVPTQQTNYPYIKSNTYQSLAQAIGKVGKFNNEKKTCRILPTLPNNNNHQVKSKWSEFHPSLGQNWYSSSSQTLQRHKLLNQFHKRQKIQQNLTSRLCPDTVQENVARQNEINRV